VPAERPRHIAVVPVADLERHTEIALDYAATLAPRVVAVHVRHDACDFEARWAALSPTASLVVIDTPVPQWKTPFVRAVNALKRTEQADLITVVVPPAAHSGQDRRRPRLSSAAALRLALGINPGIVVSNAPRQP
jgi:hypothetical protein